VPQQICSRGDEHPQDLHIVIVDRKQHRPVVCRNARVREQCRDDMLMLGVVWWYYGRDSEGPCASTAPQAGEVSVRDTSADYFAGTSNTLPTCGSGYVNRYDLWGTSSDSRSTARAFGGAWPTAGRGWTSSLKQPLSPAAACVASL
jgi:hypothetical protein